MFKLTNIKTHQTLISLFKYTQKYNFNSSQENIEHIANIPETPNKKNNLYTTKQPLIFTNGKLNIMNSTNSKTIKFNRINKNIFKSIAYCAPIGTAISLYSGYYILGSLLGALWFVGGKINHNMIQNLSRIVMEMNLLEDGKTVEVITVLKKFTVDIKSLHKPNKLDMANLLNFNPDIVSIHVPFLIESGPDKSYYYLPPPSEISINQEILNAVINRSYINVKKKIGQNNKILDV
jgi:hypothetical protein